MNENVLYWINVNEDMLCLKGVGGKMNFAGIQKKLGKNKVVKEKAYVEGTFVGNEYILTYDYGEFYLRFVSLDSKGKGGWRCQIEYAENAYYL